MKLAVTLALLFALVPTANAYRFEGSVERVLDGETLQVRETSKKSRLVHLAGIDAPAKGQKFFDSSRESLRKLALRKKVSVEWDKYNEACTRVKPKESCGVIGRVVLADGTDVSLAQVKRGMAFFNERRMEELSTPDRTMYGDAESDARRTRLGLWKQKKPVPPWEFRKKRHGG